MKKISSNKKIKKEKINKSFNIVNIIMKIPCASCDDNIESKTTTSIDRSVDGLDR